MRVTRRAFLRTAAAAAAAGSLAPSALAALTRQLEREVTPRVLWLQGAGCDGCAISFLNSVHEATAESLLTDTLSVEFQSNLMCAAGDLAVAVAEAAAATPGYVLVVEGAVPTGADGRFCTLWPGMSIDRAVLDFSVNAAAVVALGACASFGGVVAGAPNPTAATGVGGVLGADPRLVNLPGCPAHPDWLVGTLVEILASGQLPPLDEHRRPLRYYGSRVHDGCPRRHSHCGVTDVATELGQAGCLEYLGCKGKHTHSDCPMRKWNSTGAGRFGVSWCVAASSPCLGCVEPTFPDGMSPFYEYLPSAVAAPAGGDSVDDDHH